jgi:hypothetical protein
VINWSVCYERSIYTKGKNMFNSDMSLVSQFPARELI